MKALFNTKKALLGYILIFVVILAIATFVVTNAGYTREGGLVGESRDIGVLQMQLLEQIKNGEKVLLYIDQSAKLATQQSIYDLAMHGGFHNSSVERNHIGYSVWSFQPGKELVPKDIQTNLSLYMNQNLNPYLAKYADQYIPTDNYDFYFRDRLTIKGIAGTNLFLSSIPYVKGKGDPKDDKITNCKNTKCVVENANHYADMYYGMPYVWGGESPYSYQASVNDQKINSNSIFKGVELTKYQPAGNMRSGRSTLPGFDCSGLMWWIFKHTGVVDERLTANGYYELAKTNWQRVCYDEQYMINCVTEKAEAGDIIFIDPCERGVCHIAMYIGNQEIIESAGDEGVIERKIPDRYYDKVGIKAVYRPNYGTKTTAAVPTTEVGLSFDSPPVEEDFTYSIKPSFTVKLDYDLEEYKQLREGARSLTAEVKNCDEINQDCIEKKLRQLSLDWQMDCRDPGLDNFLENFILCSGSEDNYCMCEIPIEYKEEYGEEKHTIKFERYQESTVFKISELAFVIDGVIPFADLNENSYIIHDPSEVFAFDFELEYGKPLLGKKKLKNAEITITKQGEEKEFEYEKVVPFYKIDNGLVLVSEDEMEDATRTLDNDPNREMRKCTLPNKMIYKFCSESKHKVIAKDGEEYEYRPVRYEFAIDFADNTIPPVLDFNVHNNPEGKESLIVEWTSSSEDDIDHYNIYCSDGPFDTITHMQPVQKVQSTTNSVLLREWSLHDFIFNIMDGTQYYVAVVAVDKTNNYEKDVQPKTAVSVDNTVPEET